MIFRKKTFLDRPFLIPALFVFLSLGACNPAPEPSFEASTNTAKVGQPIKFKDTSKGANRLEWQFGDSIIRKDGREQIYAYGIPGSYTVTLKTWNKRERKEAQTSTSITVEPPLKGEIVGLWTYYLREDVKQWDDDRDRTTIINEMTTNQNYFFEVNDTVIINDFGTNQLVRRWQVSPDGKLAIDTGGIWPTSPRYQIVKLYENRMIWRTEAPGHFRLMYFKR
jgi:PKD repeat protein